MNKESFGPNCWPEHYRGNSQVSLLNRNEDFHLLDQTFLKIIEKDNVELVHQEQEAFPVTITSLGDHLINRPEDRPVIEGYELATKMLDKQIEKRKENNTDLEAGNSQQDRESNQSQRNHDGSTNANTIDKQPSIKEEKQREVAENRFVRIRQYFGMI